MNSPLSHNTQAILLLTAPLILGKREGREELLSLGDYNRLARKLRESRRQPADLLGTGIESKEALNLASEWFGRDRIEKLLARGFLLSQALERWTSRAIWVISRADASYPRRLKAKLREDAPPLLYGCGDSSLLDVGGLAVVGSRHVDETLLTYTQDTGVLVASAGFGLISGGARGIDAAAMAGGLRGGGVVVGVLADSLERAAINRENREPLIGKQLVLISPYDPAAGFNVGHAMQRNKLIYALADAGLVVSSDIEKGGTWTGAVEQLERLHFGPLFVRSVSDAPAGNHALIKRGAQAWPEPTDASSITELLRNAAATAISPVPQESLPLLLREEAVSSPTQASMLCSKEDKDSAVEPDESVCSPSTSPALASAAAEELFHFVRALFERELRNGLTEVEISERLQVNKAQVKNWLLRLSESGIVTKVKKSRPARYQSISRSDLLL